VTPLRTLAFGELLAQIGAKTPAPGGGAVASAAGSLAAALARMVVAYSLGKKTLTEHQPTLHAADDQLARTIDLLTGLADEDAAAFRLVSELSKLPETDERRRREYAGAIEASVQIPRAATAACVELLRLIADLTSKTNRHLRSDLAIAAVLADASARSCWMNVAINLPNLNDPGRIESLRGEGARLLREGGTLRERVEAFCQP
jgi:methenyltetrahydrofolate cyclohydrolase